MVERTVEDRLREEYVILLPDIQRILEELEVEVRHRLLPLSSGLDKHERLIVNSRIKDFESALGSLRRRQEGRIFDPDWTESYTLTDLKDLAGVRVLAFPRSRWMAANNSLRESQPFSKWDSDPIRSNDENKDLLAFKYYGYCSRNTKFRAELQIVPMSIGLFWQIEHATLYKPSPHLKRVSDSPKMRQRRDDVVKALRAFEDEFERLVQNDPRLERSERSL